ncbi:hypothetical protein [Streptomyces sp. NPDC006012]|uniref:hypothetical protein n=1 Tax=Streptomyces sp. NPDC006012 TaxID=3364739 RepID=UPI0036CE21D0
MVVEHCGALAVDVLIGAKLRTLDRVYDELKLLRRGCRIVGGSSLASPVSSASFAKSAAGAGKGCLEGAENYDVFGPQTGNKITNIDHFDDDVLWELKDTLPRTSD